MIRTVAFACVALLSLPLLARAAGSATFSLSPSIPVVTEGERFSVDVWVRPNGEELDTARAYLGFPSNTLRVVDVSLGSAFPRVAPGNGYDNSDGAVSIGAFVVGSTVTEDGVLATVTFEAADTGTATIDVKPSSRLISNGEEKADASGHVGTSVRVDNGSGDIEQEATAGGAEADVVPPNEIVPYTARVRYVEGEDALVEFGTTDDGSGIDHYEISINDGEFFEATSPYVLSDLALGDQLIEVKAIDRSGNERFGKTGIRVYADGAELKPEDLAAREKEQERIREIIAATPDGGNGGLLIAVVSSFLAVLAILMTVLYRKRRRVS